MFMIDLASRGGWDAAVSERNLPGRSQAMKCPLAKVSIRLRYA
jgi:hypothetical protein